jgi:DNA ligase D-like protein (predicted 3'-phosphoesterase)
LAGVFSSSSICIAWKDRRAVTFSQRFVVQVHDDTRLHDDFRVLSGGVPFWAVPKGPSLDPTIRRLALPVEDYEKSAGDFEGVHVGQIRGTGAVIGWDEERPRSCVTSRSICHLSCTAESFRGALGLTRAGEKRWILVKVRDEDAQPGSDIVAEQPASVRSGKTWQEVGGPVRWSGRLLGQIAAHVLRAAVVLVRPPLIR